MYGYMVGILLISEIHVGPRGHDVPPHRWKWGVLLHYFQLATIRAEGPFLILGVFDAESWGMREMYHWSPTNQRFEPTTMNYTTIDPQKFKDSNPRLCTTPPLTPINRRFEPTTMHYTTIDPPKSKIRTHDHELHQHWPPKIQRFEPTTTHYTNIDPTNVNESSPCHALHHLWPQQVRITDSIYRQICFARVLPATVDIQRAKI
jgi:hypothetical protein